MPPTAAELYRYPYSKAFLMNEHSATLLELLVLQGYLGAPVFLVAATLVGYFLRARRRRSYLLVATVYLTLPLFAVPVAAWIWSIWPFAFDIMAGGFVNLPAVTSCAMLAPVTTLFAPAERE